MSKDINGIGTKESEEDVPFVFKGCERDRSDGGKPSSIMFMQNDRDGKNIR